MGEGIVPTPHEKIMVLRAMEGCDKAAILARARWIEELAAACAPEDELMSAVQGLVPEYQEPRTGE